MSNAKKVFPVLIWSNPYGKFRLSDEAISRIKERCPDFDPSDFPRHDEVVIEVVTRLGLERSNGNEVPCQGLEIVSCTEGRYIIRRNEDGSCERMVQPSELQVDWITP